MDPLFLSLAWAVATGVGNVAGKLIEEGIVYAAVGPIAEQLKQRVQATYHTLEKNEAIARLILAAIEDASQQKGETLALQYARRLNLHRIIEPGNTSLRDEVVRLVYLASSDDFPHDISDSLLEALHLAPSERLPLARFLFFLRRRLNTLPDFRLLLEAGHQQNVERALRHMKFDLSSLVAAVTETKQGPAVRAVLAEREWDSAPYLRYLTNVCNLLPLGVIDPQYASPTSEHAIRLNDIYIDLEGANDYGRRRSVLETISSNGTSKHVILGAPGGGKSTLVNYLAYSMALDQLQPSSKWLARSSKWKLEALLPVRVILREWIAWLETRKSRQLNAQALWDYIQFDLESHGFGSSFEPLRKHLLEQGGLVLLDGLDEVPDAAQQRDIVKSVVEDFARAASLCRLVVTCRPYAYEKLEWKLSGFSEISLAPFSSEQIESFVRGWYYAVVRATGMNSALAEAKADSLIAACQLPYLTPLAEQPLLLTLMATLHTSRGNLPDDRADLYEDCVKLMLDYWQQSKRVRVDGQVESEKGILDALGISRDRLEQALNQIAYTAHDRQGRMRRRQYGTADISGDELRKTLAPLLDHSLDKANTVVHYVRTRSGLLLERDPDTFAFPHRTFQEFLTARYLLNSEDFPSNLAEWARSDRTWWHEVFLLAAGHARPYAFGQAIALINELCNTDYHPERPISGEDAYAAVLAAQAAVEVRLRERALTPRYRATLEKLQDWLVGIVRQRALTSKERAEAGRFLSILGDVRADVASAIPELVPVPVGEFTMGEDDKSHRVALGEYSIGKYPVTNAQFRRFVDDGGYSDKHKDLWTPAGWDFREKNKIEKPKWWDSPQWNYDNHPVVGVSWYEAVAYCNWLTKTNAGGRTFRLPTEAEWEKAARGDNGRKWPWGNDSEDEKANTRECGIGQTTAVGLFPHGASALGILDLAGNVAEWCSSAHVDYPYIADDGRECLEGNAERCVRGGSWRYGLSLARCTYRLGFKPDDRSDYVGLRVAAS
jgi:formylglycine-generating enzyme required for sulfatase activity